MNSSKNSASDCIGGVSLVCQVGHRVLLTPVDVDGKVADLVGRGRRQLEMAAGPHRFLLSQLPEDLDFPSFEIPFSNDLLSFLEVHGVEVTNCGLLLAKLFGTFAPLLGLMEDEVFCTLTKALYEDERLRGISVRIDGIEGHDRVILTYPTRTHLAPDDVWISVGEDGLTGGTLLQVASPLGVQDGQTMLAVLEVRRAPAKHALILGPGRIVRAEATVQILADVTAFCDSRLRSDPDVVAFLAGADSALGLLIGRELRSQSSKTALVLPDRAVQLSVDCAIPMEHGIFACGWFYDPEELIEEIVVINHALFMPVLTSGWATFPGRADFGGEIVGVKRFVTFLEHAEPKCPSNFVLIWISMKGDESHLLVGPPPPPDPVSQRDTILGSIVGHALTIEMMQRIYEPAVAPLQHRINARQTVRQIHEYGRRSKRTVSIVIPLYRELGFIRSQLMAFAVDPFIRENCELVYVLDDPIIAPETDQRLQRSVYAFPLDIKLVILEKNGGYALANNLGVEKAQGEILVLLNSDAVPRRPGWVEKALAKLQTLPSCSVIGPKLLYADDSLQHAGMYFECVASDYWQNFHYWKGFAREFTPAVVERAVPAVTGACMVLRKQDFLNVGGFTTDYVVGDYEDSDLCLKLRDNGGEAYYMPSIELYHFERQSIPTNENRDRASTIYNRALHTRRWDNKIREIMKGMKGTQHV